MVRGMTVCYAALMVMSWVNCALMAPPSTIDIVIAAGWTLIAGLNLGADLADRES